MSACSYCGIENREGAIYCASCGCVLEDHFGQTATLTWLDELDQIEQKYVVGEADRFVGRDSSNDIVLADDQVSVRHVKISFVGGEFRAADLGSSNGTYVNGEQIEGSRDLVDEDLLRIGTTIVRFCGPP